MNDLEDLDLSHDLALALDVVDAIDTFTLPHFREADFTIDWKRNQTEVTEVDRRAETMIVDHLVHERPGHGGGGEVLGARIPGADLRLGEFHGVDDLRDDHLHQVPRGRDGAARVGHEVSPEVGM